MTIRRQESRAAPETDGVASGKPKKIVYRERDGKPMGETGIHVMVTYRLLGLLLDFYEAREDVHVTGDIFLYYEEGNPRAVVSPDLMVIFGVPKEPPRRTFKVWEEGGAVPRLVIEVTSRSTRREDQIAKRAIYERLGIREYFLFDPLDEYVHPQLRGYRLDAGTYREIPLADDNSLVSEVLGLRLAPRGIHLQLRDLALGRELLTGSESAIVERGLRDAESRRAAAEQRRAEHAEALLAAERDRADAEAAIRRLADQRIAELEAQLAERERRADE